MFASIRRRLQKNDEGVSPVIGTILMVAATVVLGATVIGAINAFGSEEVTPQANAVWRAQAIDTNGNGQTDTLKITYLNGPSGIAASQVLISVVEPEDADGPTYSTGPAPATWSPGDFVLYTGAGTYHVTVSVLGNVALDQSVTLAETLA